MSSLGKSFYAEDIYCNRLSQTFSYLSITGPNVSENENDPMEIKGFLPPMLIINFPYQDLSPGDQGYSHQYSVFTFPDIPKPEAGMVFAQMIAYYNPGMGTIAGQGHIVNFEWAPDLFEYPALVVQRTSQDNTSPLGSAQLYITWNKLGSIII